MDTEGDRSLSSGISFPQWMKNKMNNRLDLDQSTFSPPEHDDTFLYIRYPNVNNNNNSKPSVAETTKFTPITDIIKRDGIQVDFKNHTKPCQEYLAGIPKTHLIPPPTIKIVKSNGIDDGFKGDSAACGTSIVRVAHQMVTQRGFNLPEDDKPATPPVGWDPSKRRGSRSAPSSPTRQRKQLSQQPNKYFTSAFENQSAVDKYQGSWLLSGLLGKRENISKSMNILTEDEKKEEEENSLEKKKSPSGQIFKAKPSELREMNFWSPTSM